MLDVEVVGHVEQLLHLLLERLGEHGMVVAQAVRADAGEKVAVLATVIAHQRHAVATNELNLRAPVRVHHIARFQFLLLFERH